MQYKLLGSKPNAFPVNLKLIRDSSSSSSASSQPNATAAVVAPRFLLHLLNVAVQR